MPTRPSRCWPALERRLRPVLARRRLRRKNSSLSEEITDGQIEGGWWPPFFLYQRALAGIFPPSESPIGLLASGLQSQGYFGLCTYCPSFTRGGAVQLGI